MSSRATRHLASIIGDNLRAARAGADMTQREVGAAIGVESVFVSRWERGRNSPNAINLQRLADLFFEGDVSALYREVPEEEAATA